MILCLFQKQVNANRSLNDLFTIWGKEIDNCDPFDFSRIDWLEEQQIDLDEHRDSLWNCRKDSDFHAWQREFNQSFMEQIDNAGLLML